MSKAKTPYDRSNGVKRVHLSMGPKADDEGKLLPVVVFAFKKTSAIEGSGNELFFSPDQAVAVGEQLIAAGKGETPNE